MAQPNLRPLTFGEVLDGAFSLYRRHFSTFFTTALLPLLPLAVLWVVTGAMLPRSPESLAVMTILQTIASPYTLLATLLIWATITLQGAEAYAGEQPSTALTAYRKAVGRLPSLLGAGILASLAIGIGLLFLLIPGFLAMIMFFAIVPVIVLEGRGAFEGLGRSRALARGAWGRIFGVLVLLMLITSLPALTIGFGTGLSFTPDVDSETFNTLGYGLMQALSAIGTALTTPLLVLGILLQYYDRRVRAEGLDLELATEQLSTTAS